MDWEIFNVRENDMWIEIVGEIYTERNFFIEISERPIKMMFKEYPGISFFAAH